MTTQVTSMIEHQARQHIIAIADEMGWHGSLASYEWFAPVCTPRLKKILTAAHEFKRTHRSVNPRSKVPMLRILANILTHVFPQPVWEGEPLRPMTKKFNEAWRDAQDILSLYWDKSLNYQGELIVYGVSPSLAFRAAMIRLSGGPIDDADQEIVQWVADILRRNS